MYVGDPTRGDLRTLQERDLELVSVYLALHLLSSFMGSPCPPPDLLYTSKGKRGAPIAEEKKQKEALWTEGQTIAQGSQQTEQTKQQYPRRHA